MRGQKVWLLIIHDIYITDYIMPLLHVRKFFKHNEILPYASYVPAIHVCIKVNSFCFSILILKHTQMKTLSTSSEPYEPPMWFWSVHMFQSAAVNSCILLC